MAVEMKCDRCKNTDFWEEVYCKECMEYINVELAQAYERIDSLEHQLYEIKDGRNFHHRENDNE